MELKKTYNVNIIGIDESHDYLIITEQFNSDATQYFQNYYEQLLCFNKCSQWFGKLEYPQVEIGNVIIVRVHEVTNLWARGIISKLQNKDLLPQIYLVDSQRFCDNNGKLEMRACPDKFLNLKLPTYNINTNFDLADGSIKIAIKKLIWKNQCGELSFCFTPKSINNNVYSGDLTIKNIIDHSIIPLKKFLKNIQKKNYFHDIPKDKQCTYSNFNPLKLINLKNIFIPNGLSNINCVNITESDIKKYSIDVQSIEMDVNKGDDFIKVLMRKRCNILSNVSSSNGYKEHCNSTITPENLAISRIPSTIEIKDQTINSLADDSNVWWSSSSEDES